MQTGIARMMGEVTRRYPRGELLVSTGQHRDSQDSDVHFSGAVVDRLARNGKAVHDGATEVYGGILRIAKGARGDPGGRRFPPEKSRGRTRRTAAPWSSPGALP